MGIEHWSDPRRGPGMRILISGSSGFIGSALIPVLTNAHHDIVPLVRKRGIPRSVYWEPGSGVIDVEGLKGLDAVVHLAGESIAEGRWTAAKKAKILDSR